MKSFTITVTDLYKVKGVTNMAALKLGWLDFTSNDRNKVLSVLDALSAPDAVDELGIGLIRDGFADLLFPGTSTLHTKAKYYFIVPYLLMELERESITSREKFLEELSAREIDLIEILKQSGDEGVIGARAGNKLKRKPSSIYWNGLRTFGMFKHGKLSLEKYVNAVVSMKNSNLSLVLGNEEEDDLKNIQKEYSGTFWRCISPEPKWKENVVMNLSNDEAFYLKERITKADQSKYTLLAFLLKQNINELEKIDSFDVIGEAFSLPDYIQIDYQRALDFREFISGANIRYNLILSNGNNKEALDRWEEWFHSSFVKNKLPFFNYMDIIWRLEITNSRLRSFLSNWKQVVINRDEAAIDQLIIKREIELKSKERAKLNNASVYTYKEGDWFGSMKLDFRFKQAKNLISDINTGLEG